MGSLLQLPLEIRYRIYNFLFTDEHGLIHIELLRKYNASDISSWRACCLPRWHASNWIVYHPIFFVSKHIKHEAEICYHVEFKVSRDSLCQMRKVTKAGNSSLEVYTIYGHAGQSFSPDKKCAWHMPAQIGVYEDDFRKLLRPSLRFLIKHIRLHSVYGCDGRFINREQFPRLELVTIGSLVKYRGSRLVMGQYTVGTFETLNRIDLGGLKAGETCAEAKADAYDDKFVSEILSSAKWFTFRHLEQSSQRAFPIHLMVPVFVYEKHSKSRGFDLVIHSFPIMMKYDR